MVISSVDWHVPYLMEKRHSVPQAPTAAACAILVIAFAMSLVLCTCTKLRRIDVGTNVVRRRSESSGKTKEDQPERIVAVTHRRPLHTTETLATTNWRRLEQETKNKDAVVS